MMSFLVHSKMHTRCMMSTATCVALDVTIAVQGGESTHTHIGESPNLTQLVVWEYIHSSTTYIKVFVVYSYCSG